MAAEHLNGDDCPKQTWNSSTKLTQSRCPATAVGAGGRQASDAPRRAKCGPGRPASQSRKDGKCDAEDTAFENEQQTLTRELLERAVSTAFGGLLQDSTVDATTFFNDREAQLSESSNICDKESISSPVNNIEAKLRTILAKSTYLSANHRQKRRDYLNTTQQASSTTKKAKEIQRRMKHASFEHHERKLAVQALQARIQREVEYLVATAADLEKREYLLDDAFESYEHALRLELGLVDKTSFSSN